MPELDDILDQLLKARDSADDQRCIHLCRQGIAVVPDANWRDWYGLRLLLATFLLRDPDSKDNVEEAIRVLEEILGSVEHDQDPHKWAFIQRSLAHAYEQRLRHGGEENLEKAIQHYSAALAVYSKSGPTLDEAVTRDALAECYAKRRSGSRVQNLRAEVEHLTAALKVFGRDSYPEEWANILSRLQMAQRELDEVTAR